MSTKLGTQSLGKTHANEGPGSFASSGKFTSGLSC